ncbi:hypothetical protein FLW16_12515 [Microbispora sp. KK1-11]|nr:hypothetical protein FLW16_12515 [Microbispora sp. KK1-11]
MRGGAGGSGGGVGQAALAALRALPVDQGGDLGDGGAAGYPCLAGGLVGGQGVAAGAGVGEDLCRLVERLVVGDGPVHAACSFTKDFFVARSMKRSSTSTPSACAMASACVRLHEARRPEASAESTWWLQPWARAMARALRSPMRPLRTLRLRMVISGLPGIANPSVRSHQIFLSL